MKANILPTYIDSDVEYVDVSEGAKSISGRSSFVLVTGPESELNSSTLILPSRTVDDRCIIPGTLVTVVRKDTGAGAVIVGLGNIIPSGTDTLYGTSTLTAATDSCTFMYVGGNVNTDYNAWILISSDLATPPWNGGTVGSLATFNGTVNFNSTAVFKGITKIGNGPADELQIASNFRFSDYNNNPTITVDTAGNGTATLNEAAHPNAAIISFSGVWASGDTAVITLPTNVTFETERFILKNQASTVNGNIEVTANDEITFTATGTCVGDLGYLVIVMGS